MSVAVQVFCLSANVRASQTIAAAALQHEGEEKHEEAGEVGKKPNNLDFELFSVSACIVSYGNPFLHSG